MIFVVVLLLFSHSVMSDFVNPWTAQHQASLSITNSQSLFKLMSIESVMPSSHLILWAMNEFSSVQSISRVLTLCNPMDYSTSGFPIHHQLSELAQTYVHRVNDAIQPSHPLSSHSPPSFPASGSFPVSQFFALGDQSIGASPSASVLPMNIQA